MRLFVKRFALPILGVIAIGLLVALLAFTLARVRLGNVTTLAKPQSTDRLGAYWGLGSWIDLWDAGAWRNPAAAVKDMADHGVRTIYIQTGNARSIGGISNPAAMRAFITEAHARGMYVVAWYLPNLKPGSVDYDRVVQAVQFTTEDGQKFDSFALDIESTAVKPLSARNRNLAALSKRIRELVGPSYPLGGIIPSPVGLKKQTGFWNVFPYANVARDYDVLLPMAYYTFHGHTASQARKDVLDNMRILRAQPGCSKIPVHLIGGLAGESSAAEMQAFARASREASCVGISVYDWVGMNDARWTALRAGWPPSP